MVVGRVLLSSDITATLSKALAEEGIILVKNGQNTYTKRYGGNVRRRVMCIKKSEVKNIYGE